MKQALKKDTSRSVDGEALKVALEALDHLACWEEGATVTLAFDSPWTATTARQALQKIRGGDGRPKAQKTRGRILSLSEAERLYKESTEVDR